MPPLLELNCWRAGVDSGSAEREIRNLRDQLATTDRSIEEGQKLLLAEESAEVDRQSIIGLRERQLCLETDLAELMKGREIEILDFALDGRRYATHQAQAKSLSLFLDVMQRLFERVGQSLSVPSPGAQIPPDIRRMCQLDVAGFFPSSFGIKFAAQTRSDLIGNSLSGNTLEATFDLLNSKNPVEQAAKIGVRAINQYRHFVTTLIKIEATPKAAWVNPAGESRSWISDDNNLLVLANRLANIRDLAPRTLTATGVLTGASLRRQKFEFSGDSGVLTGKAPREMAGKVTANFGKVCRITYVETVFIDETTDQEKHTRTLLDIDDVC